MVKRNKTRRLPKDNFVVKYGWNHHKKPAKLTVKITDRFYALVPKDRKGAYNSLKTAVKIWMRELKTSL